MLTWPRPLDNEHGVAMILSLMMLLALTGDLDILDEVKQAEFFLVDGVIVTGARTTEPPSLPELRRVKKRPASRAASTSS